ncbi:MAG TPA: hypothetical protein VH255_05190 [Verrucomicrobiae bacterium]|nr:hypothetical protein [Verrucomicrobiae bacterium]
MKPVTIIGGGLAGLTLGIALRREKIPVTLHEAGKYPRHRVCGEFISGRGQNSLRRLGLLDLIEHTGSVRAKSVAFFSKNKSTSPRMLPVSAVCLSRFDLDEALAKEFTQLGGELLENSRWRGDFGEGLVRSTGRKPQTNEDDGWFGLKIHARKVTLSADLEMHLSKHGYTGICYINRGEVDICGLLRRRKGEGGAPRNWREWLNAEPDSSLSRRLSGAEFDEDSFCAVAGLSLRPQRATARGECCVGDAITMIPPVTGNGMSMAFESAELAIGPLARWSHGEILWETAQREIARSCDAAFARRLTWAKWLQRALLTPALQNPLISLMERSDWFWRMGFERTR